MGANMCTHTQYPLPPPFIRWVGWGCPWGLESPYEPHGKNGTSPKHCHKRYKVV